MFFIDAHNPGALGGNWRAKIVATLLVLTIVLPWLNPFAPGPSASMVPWLVSLAATAILLILCQLYVSCATVPLEIAGAQSGEHQQPLLLAQVAAISWALAGVMSSLIALTQYFGVAGSLSPWIVQGQSGEAFANLRQRNQFASLTNIALASLVWLSMHPGVPTKRADLLMSGRWMLFLAAMLLAVGNAASSSRTGALQLVLLSALSWLWHTRRLQLAHGVLFTAVVTYVFATLTLPWLAGLDPSFHGILVRLKDGDSVCSSRLTLWSNVLTVIAQKPWLGWGWGELDYAHYITRYDGARFCGILDNAHNLILHLAVELGVPASLVICIGLFLYFLRLAPWREKDVTRQLAWSVLAVILLHSMLEYPLWYGPFQMAVALCVALLWTSRIWLPNQPNQPNQPNRESSRRKRRLAQTVSILIATVLIALSVYAGWDYHRISQIYLAPAARDVAYREDTLNKIRSSWLFHNQVQFAELSMTPLTRENAQWTFDSATSLLHYSPEPRVIEKAIESAILLGRADDAAWQLLRYKAAFPEDAKHWSELRASNQVQP